MGSRFINRHNALTEKFKTLPLDEPWLSLIGTPQQTGTWFIYGNPKNGKTSFALQLAAYMSKFSRTVYDTIEEGKSLSFMLNIERNNVYGIAGTRFLIADKMPIDELVEELKKKNSPNFIIIDSIQFADLKFSEYKTLKDTFHKKIFCYISHVQGNAPDGNIAKRIYRDANVIFRVEGFRAFCTSRFGGSGHYDISPEMAKKYWNN